MAKTLLNSVDDARAVVLNQIERLGWSRGQTAAAAKTYGVSRTTVYDFVGNRLPGVRLVDFVGICQAVGIDVSSTARAKAPAAPAEVDQ